MANEEVDVNGRPASVRVNPVSGIERLSEGIIWWVILAAIALMNFEFIQVKSSTGIYVLTALIGAFNFLLHHTIPGRLLLRHRTYWQVIVQLIFTAGLVNLTGGIHSRFYFVYFLPIILTTVVINQRRLTTEVLALVSLLTVAEAAWSAGSRNFISTLPITTLKIFTLVTVGVFSNELGRWLAREKKESEEKSQQLLDRARQLAAVRAVASHINSNIEIDKTFPLMAQEAKKIVPFDRASIALSADGGTRMELLAVSGVGEESFGVSYSCPLPGTVLEQALERGQPVVRAELTPGDSFTTTDLLLAEGLRSHISFPLISHGQILGSLNLSSVRPGLVTSFDQDILKPLVEEVAMALSNHMLFKRVKQESITDSLTELYNHRYFQEQLELEIKKATRRDRPLAMIIGDLDHFKVFNDMNGHVLGDEALRNVAKLLRSSVRAEDLVARYGGEEFVILLSETDGPGALLVAERLRRRIEEFKFNTKPDVFTPLTISTGIAVFPQDAHVREWLVKRADQALYIAKRRGRNQVCLFSQQELSLDELSPTELVKEDLSLGLIQALAAAVDAKDAYTYRHSEAVSKFARVLAKGLGMSPGETEEIKMAGLLHDVGKIGISDDILRKPGRLTPEEWGIIKQHSQLACNILKHVLSLHPIMPAVLHHHERYDGGGYPAGLKGDDIPLAARILCLADSYHALISDRPYRKAFSPQAALEEIKNGSGTQFDPALVKVFVQVLFTTPSELT